MNPSVLISDTLKPHNLQQVSEVPPLYKHTMTPPCCHSTEQCTSAEYEQKNCTNIQKLRVSGVIGGMGKQEQDRKDSGAIVEWPDRLSLWQGHYWTLGTHMHARTQSQKRAKRFAKLTRRVCRWTLCSFPHLSSQWKLRTSVSPSDAWPAWTWPSDYLKHTHFTSYFYTLTIGVYFTVEQNGQQSSRVAYQWSFLLWRREWLLQAISSQLGMWPLEEYGSSRRSQSSHLSQLGSWDWRLPCWSSWGDSLTEQGKRDKSQIYLYCKFFSVLCAFK